MTYDETSDNYVAWINAPDVLGGYKLGKFSNGNKSGWMYTVNGIHPDLGLCEYVLSDGEEVIWHYGTTTYMPEGCPFVEAEAGGGR